MVFPVSVRLSTVIETSPNSSLEKAIEAVKASTKGSLSVDNQDYFLRTALPKFVQYLLQRKYVVVIVPYLHFLQ
jgi:hypothetical protein